MSVTSNAVASTAHPLPVILGGTGASTAATALTSLGAVPLAGGTMTGNLILNTDPTLPLQAATKEYVDTLAGGLSIQTPCVAATTAALTATYSNGTLGVGATLTNSGAQAAFATDGITPSVTNRILVWDQAAPAQNGIYTLTTAGSNSTNWVLTRATDYNTAGTQIKPGNLVNITSGTTYGTTSWLQTATVTTIGTDPITFVQFGGPFLRVSSNLSDVGSASTSRTNLGVAIGADVEAWSAQLDSIAAIGNGIPAHTAANTFTARTLTGTSNRLAVTNGTGVSGNPTFDIDAAYVGQSSITTLGTIATGVWNGTAVTGTYGGTGVNNGASTITIGGNVAFSGAFTFAGTVTGNTTVTFPTTGTLVNTGVTTLSSLASVGTITTGTWSATLKDYVETNNIDSQASAYAINLANGNVHSLTMTGNVTLSFSNVPAGTNCCSVTLFLIQDGTGSRIPTFPGSVIWPGGSAPTFTTTALHVDEVVMTTTNAGTTWRAASILNFAS